MKSLAEWVQHVRTNAVEKGWRGEKAPTRTVPEEVALIHSEVSEMLEDFRSNGSPTKWSYTYEKSVGASNGWMLRQDGEGRWLENTLGQRKPASHENMVASGYIAVPHGVPIEAADVVIRIMDFAGEYGIDLERMIEIKMEYNHTRPQRHGGKFL